MSVPFRFCMDDTVTRCLSPYGATQRGRTSKGLSSEAPLRVMSPTLGVYGAESTYGGFVRQIGRQIACAKAPRVAVGPGRAIGLGRTVRGVRNRPIRRGVSCGRFRAR